jgi:hypothetical protein
MKQDNQKAIPNDVTQVDESRRNLLKGIATATVVGGIAAGTTKVVKAEDNLQPVESSKTSGYRDTQHIRDYYDTL